MSPTGPTMPRPVADAVQSGRDIALRVAAELPLLRRHARALTGSAQGGDRCARTALEAVLADRSQLHRGISPRLALFRALHRVAAPDLRPTRTRHAALLLRRTGAFDPDEIAAILGLPAVAAEPLAPAARAGTEMAARPALQRHGTDGRPGH